MNILFLHSQTLVTRELAHALTNRKDITCISVQIPVSPPPESIDRIFDTLVPYTPALFLSINDAGYDKDGIFQKRILQSGSSIVNWYHDYPFYDHDFKGRQYVPSKNRIDFVSEKTYVNLITARGGTSFFLPLATDPAYFSPQFPRTFERDIAFVGNSSLVLMDRIITEEVSNEITRHKELYHYLKNAYYKDFTISVRDLILEQKHAWLHTITVPEETFVFCMEWLIGYQFRRDFIVDVSNTYTDQFTVFGDLYWQQFITKSRVTPEACYYDNLCRYYRTTKINLNVNRIQIRTSFTQRHFDCKASGAFLLTDKRACNADFFITDGPDQEIVQFDSLAQCHEQIRYYLAHEDERERIAQNGIQRILKNHTYDNRIEEIKTVCTKVWGI
jgi:spore maturation protein CgeB